MILQSVKKIKGHKSFQNFNWHPFLNSESFHNEVNIFYGENGSGKSSICNILKNISENKEFVVSKTPSEVSLVFDDKQRNFKKNTGWNSKLPKDSIVFFDREFIAKNIHLGHRRDTTQNGQEQESGKMIIEFDQEAIILRENRDKAKLAKEKQDQDIKDFNNLNRVVLSLRLNDEEETLYKIYKDKRKKEIEVSMQELLKEKKEIEKCIETDKDLQKKAMYIQSDIEELKKHNIKITLSSYNSYQTFFNFDLKDRIQIKTDQLLVDTIINHKHFFDTGLDIRKTHLNRCPFCQSKNEEVGIKKIIDIYNQIYSTNYDRQIQKFELLKTELVDELSLVIKTLAEFDLTSIFLELKRIDERYKLPNIYSVEEEKKYNKPKIVKTKELVDKILKFEKPSNENIQYLYSNVMSEFEAIDDFFQKVNIMISQKNKLITKFKINNTDKKLQFRIDSNTLKDISIDKEIAFINQNKITEQKNKIKKEKEQDKLLNKYTTLKNIYDIAIKEYEDHCSTKAFSNILSKIEDYFKNFNFSFKLQLKVDPTGNKVEFPFAFRVLDYDGNERDFNDGLSEGEVQILSLCFFFAFLDIQKDKKEKIIVFDDPITSLDNSNLSCLVDLLASVYKNFAQTFVLTHHRAFFKFLRKRFDKHCNEYNIIRNKKEFGGSFICKSADDKFIERLRNFDSDLLKIPPKSIDLELKVVEYGQFLRYEVERYIKNTLLHWDADRDFTLAIEGVKANKLISDENLNKIKGIYSFCNWTTSHVDVGDDNGISLLKNKISEFINIVQ